MNIWAVKHKTLLYSAQINRHFRYFLVLYSGGLLHSNKLKNNRKTVSTSISVLIIIWWKLLIFIYKHLYVSINNAFIFILHHDLNNNPSQNRYSGQFWSHFSEKRLFAHASAIGQQVTVLWRKAVWLYKSTYSKLKELLKHSSRWMHSTCSTTLCQWSLILWRGRYFMAAQHSTARRTQCQWSLLHPHSSLHTG